MKVLYFCNTYSQLINAINLQINLFKAEDADIVLSDHSVGANNVVNRLKEINVFSSVKVVASKKYTYQVSKWQHINDALFIKSNKCLSEFIDVSKEYDLIVYFNIELILYKICDVLVSRGHIPKLIRMEEGLTSYFDFKKINNLRLLPIIREWRKLTGQFDLYYMTDQYAVYLPEIMERICDKKTLTIPKLSRTDKRLIEILNYIFEFDPKDVEFHQKYIYFATSLDIDGIHVGETELVKEIASLVESDNLLVKMHPRDTRTVYEDAGINVSRESRVPWEVIQLNHDFDEHIFMSLTSVSIMNATVMLNDKVKTFYLYPLCKGKETSFDIKADEVDKIYEMLSEMNLCSSIVRIDNLNKIK